MKHAQMTIRGRITAVFYAGPRFSAGRLVTPSGDEIQFAGRLYAREHEQVVLTGRWITHPKYGCQFDVEAMEYDLELDTDGLANYLANHPDIKGIGPAKARLIAERFGRDFDRAITENREAVAQAALFFGGPTAGYHTYGCSHKPGRTHPRMIVLVFLLAAR